MYINFYIDVPTHIEIWGRNVHGAKRPVGAKRPGANRPGAKCLEEEMDLGRNDPEPTQICKFFYTVVYTILNLIFFFIILAS